ncbi:MAG: hypothetical protein HY606_01385 [Planctomycetes bacterium]|nr:hypothetical protein [Planctomycetota bacterium]
MAEGSILSRGMAEGNILSFVIWDDQTDARGMANGQLLDFVIWEDLDDF